MTCLNWRNCIGTPVGLSYAYLAAPKDTVATTPLYRGASNTVDLRLPVGDSKDESRSQVTVVVSDGMGESAESYVYPVTVSNIPRFSWGKITAAQNSSLSIRPFFFFLSISLPPPSLSIVPSPFLSPHFPFPSLFPFFFSPQNPARRSGGVLLAHPVGSRA